MNALLPLTLRDRVVPPAEFPVVMGVLNVTPDSFSDGGKYAMVDAAVEHASRLAAEGAAIIDVGAESTRPGSVGVDPQEQIRRATPVIERIRANHPRVTISIDTCSAVVAGAAINAGADIVNDTSALRDDPDMLDVIVGRRMGVVLMHRRGTPLDMQAGGGPHYDDVVGEVAEFLAERAAFAVAGGASPERIWIDPGIGFGKRPGHNISILRHMDRFVQLGYPVLVGASRKGFIGELSGVEAPVARLGGSVACAVLAALAGATVVRAHDVAATVQALRVARAVQCG